MIVSSAVGARAIGSMPSASPSGTPRVGEPARRLLCDAMTSGGLLVAVAPPRAPWLPGPVIGRLASGDAGRIRVASGGERVDGA